VAAPVGWPLPLDAASSTATTQVERLRGQLKCAKLNQVVEYHGSSLDAIYGAISHPVRRTLLERLTAGRARVTELAGPFNVSLAAVSKHIRVLEDAGLVRRSIRGREHWLALEASRLEAASQWLDAYRRFWEAGLGRLEAHLKDPTG
jgi:DNA-binding transcriptional ArsR family regulator